MLKQALFTVAISAALPIYSFPAPEGPQEGRRPLTIEMIFDGSLATREPSELQWAPDGRIVSYFQREGKGDRSLWILDVTTGEKKQILSAEQIREIAPSAERATEKERERTRRTRFRVNSYLWSPAGQQILFCSGERLYLHDPTTRETRELAPSKGQVHDPKFSPDGHWVSFIYRSDLWIVPAGEGEEKQITFGGHELLLHGGVDWVYAEEFDVRTGYYWSPDSRHIAFLEMNESEVPRYPITDELSEPPVVELQHYPKAGDPNPKVRIGIVAIKTGRTVWLDPGAEYLPRFGWADAETLSVQRLNRRQTELGLLLADPGTGRTRVVLEERDAHWLNMTNDLFFLSRTQEFVWTSERDGFRHIYLYDRTGRLVRRLTKGEWVVEAVLSVDEQTGWVYYTSNQSNSIGNDLFRVRLDGSETERLTDGQGTHRVVMSPDSRAFADASSALREAPASVVRDLVSGRISTLYSSRSFDEFDLVSPEMVELRTDDGAVVRVELLKPRDLEQGTSYPVVVYVYGMAGFPTIQDSWPGRRGLFHQFLVQQGFIVAQVDDRTSAVAGHKYAVAGWKQLGPVAAKDHETAVRYLQSLPFVAPDRIGVWGWSGGGFTTAFHMTHTNLFKVGIAGAPVTDWHLYDSIYTERYMGLPQDDPSAYERTSAIKGAENYRGRLLLIHGTHDDNVHPQNSIQLANALIRNKKQFDLMLYPNKTHSISGEEESIHLYTMIYEYLARHLSGTESTH